MADIKLIVGLNNPGLQYKNTRHNAGRWVVEAIAQAHNVLLKDTSSFFGEYGQIHLSGKKVHLLLPTTFMNLSGKSIIAVMNFYKIKPEEILVIHDELALKPGQTRLKFAGGHNGHNGLRDIHRVIGDKYWRLRFGIDHPGDKNKVTSHVLGQASEKEKEEFIKAINNSVEAIEQIYATNIDKVMNTFNK